MSETSARLGLPYLLAAQAQKHLTHNEALARLDLLVQMTVQGFGATVPPASPAEGEMHALGPGATGDWAGADGRLAAFTNGGWLFLDPAEGWRAVDAVTGQLRVRLGGDWVVQPLNATGLLGVNTTADSTNRLSVAADATLFNHDGAGHQLKINKAAAAETGTLLFQTGWSGRAEMGLAGSDAWSVKVSADGSAWTTALSLDPATGLASGAAVQSGPADTTAGRLMRADYGYGPGTLLGPVSQSGGVPTGAVIERGSNAGGSYLRHADGTQICRHTVSLPHASAAVCAAVWAFPASFAAAPTVTIALRSTTGATPVENHMAATRIGSISATVAELRQPRVTGTTDFAPGDTVTVEAVAIGTWF